MMYKATIGGAALAVTDTGLIPGQDGPDTEASRKHALDFIAVAHGYGDYEQLCREIPDAKNIALTPVK